MENALSMRKVGFTYRDSAAKALDGVDLDIRRGEFVTLLGANGSGKSTICLLANGLIPHAVSGTLEGTVEVFGEGTAAKSVAELSTRVGIVFQEPESQLFCMSVEEEVAFGPENLAVPRNELKDRVRWALSLVGLDGYNSRAPSTLSGGEKQRVAIAAALSMRPDMLVLDEPAYALDPVGRLELFAVLRDLKNKHGMTVLLAERDAEEAAAFSDKLVLVKGGRIVAQGPPRRLVCDLEAFRAAGLEPTQLGDVSSLLNTRLGGSEFSFLTVDEAESAVLDRVLKGGGGRGR